ncbi:hypothetical protein CRE_16795 [Caenorhabditis remanei]|uniref:Uncharacterized protein n=1 Tax=Caenorhabditis remanei TaxID=31234 RepID=E3MB56_CAERE|nr:hypothetical protein CRE_16795 [Caenorhabditis remanei]
MELTFEKHLELVAEVKHDTEKLVKLINDTMELTGSVLADSRNWSLEMELKYPDHGKNTLSINNNIVSNDRKRNSAITHDAVVSIIPAKKSF